MTPLIPPRLSIGQYFVAAIVIVVLAWGGVMTWKLRSARAAAAANALRADSTAAEADHSRAVAIARGDSIRIFGDSLRASERRAVQLRKGPSADALDRATGRTSVVRGGVTVTPGEITTSATASSTTDASDVRSASFHVDSSRAVATPKFKADADVTIPHSPLVATLKLGVSLSPIHLSPRVQCGTPDPAGVRPATLLVEGPAGYGLEVEPSQVDVHACNPDFGRPGGIRVPLSVAVGASLVTAVLVTVFGHR